MLPIGAAETLAHAKKTVPLSLKIDPITVERFKGLMWEQLVSGEASARKA